MHDDDSPHTNYVNLQEIILEICDAKLDLSWFKIIRANIGIIANNNNTKYNKSLNTYAYILPIAIFIH